MASRDAIRVRGVVSRPREGDARVARSRRPVPVPPSPRRRLAYLDRLKVLLVAVIIAAHGVAGYSGFEGAWPYQPHREVRLSGVSDVVLGMLLLPSLVFVMGLFFLISGLVTPGSLERKGPRRFARDRIVRLGIPLAIVVLGIWPALVYVGNRVGGQNASYWTQFIHAKPFLDPGPMWFVEVLLIYSLGYAGWRGWRRHHAPRPDRTADGRVSLSGRTLVLLAVAISLITIPVRFVFPWDSHQVADLQLWQWPQYLAMFGLGIVAGRSGWLDRVPEDIRRRCRTAALAGLFAVLILILAVVAAGLDPGDAFSDLRFHWAPIALAAIEGPLVVGASVWLLATAQRHLNHPPTRRGRALARSAFGAYVFQGPVLIGLALALRPVGLPAEIKALLVACLGVAGSFALGWALVSRTKLSRIL